VEYVTELKRLTEYGVLSTPALMIDGVVVSAGRTLKKREILPLLEGKA
jgi:predicted thioredoxin/glutaredoxin